MEAVEHLGVVSPLPQFHRFGGRAQAARHAGPVPPLGELFHSLSSPKKAWHVRE